MQKPSHPSDNSYSGLKFRGQALLLQVELPFTIQRPAVRSRESKIAYDRASHTAFAR